MAKQPNQQSQTQTSLPMSQETCSICLGDMAAGQGQSIFIAECSHSFHYTCISESFNHGNHLCPVCNCQWKDYTPFRVPVPSRVRRPILYRPPQSSPEPQEFTDDEPLPSNSSEASSSAASTSTAASQSVTLKSFPELSAIAASESKTKFAVQLGVRAPPLLETSDRLVRAPLDLVAVLDVSGSMQGRKLELLKHAVEFVIRNLGPSDRFTIVTFSAEATRILPLRCMTEQGREDAIRAINLLSAQSTTNIAAGLEKGVRILVERREKNPVASIMLLSDGLDNHRLRNGDMIREVLPASICGNEEASAVFPVHTFGFGSDHDPALLNAISNASGGTFSFIEVIEIIHDAFARCIGGLLSVVAQKVRLITKAISPGVLIESIPSGRHLNFISNQGRQGVIDVGDLYADEEKEFLIYLTIPSVAKGDNEEEQINTSLIEVTCTFKRANSDDLVEVKGDKVEVRRPEFLSPGDLVKRPEVDRQKDRLLVTEAIQKAQALAESGNLDAAKTVLKDEQETLQEKARDGSEFYKGLASEVEGCVEMLMSKQMYQQRGRAFMAAGLSAHTSQRATTRGQMVLFSQTLEGATVHQNVGHNSAYDTAFMRRMVKQARDEQLPQ